MDSKLENKIWWFIYEVVGVHPDDYDIDFTSPESVEESLKSLDLGEFEVPRVGGPSVSFARFCMEAANNSILVDKTFAYSCAKKSKEVKKLWEEGDPSDAPQVDNEVLAIAHQRSGGFKVV